MPRSKNKDAAASPGQKIDDVNKNHNTDGALSKATARLTVDIGDKKADDVKSDDRSKDGMGFMAKVEKWSPSESFVRTGRSKSEDPFQTPATRRSHKASQSTASPKSVRMKTGNWRSSNDSDTVSSDSAPLESSANRHDAGSPGKRGPFGRSGSTGVMTAEDAQSRFPPGYCVFVANLLQSENEESLQAAVTQVFRDFGPVFVKIRRDGKDMPFAFCQFTNAEDAQRAVKEGKGRVIRGRPCRTEMSKAHRLFIIEYKSGAPMAVDDARSLLEVFGPIEKCYAASDLERATFNLGDAVIARFEMYDHGQDAQNALRNHEKLKFMALPQAPSPSRIQRLNTTNPEARRYNEQYEIDRVSLFCGNLTPGTTSAEVNELFHHFGTLIRVDVKESPSKFDPTEKLCFAFVQFADVLACVKAIEHMDGTPFGGRNLKVNSKVSGPSRPTPARMQMPPPQLTPAPDRRRYEPAPMTPASHMATPPAYGAQPAFGAYYSPANAAFYGFGASPMVDGSQYYSTGYPYNYSYSAGYPAAPVYDPRSNAPSDGSNASAHSGYYGTHYSPYNYAAPSPYNWGASGQATGFPAPIYQGQYQAQVNNTVDPSTTSEVTTDPVAETQVEASVDVTQ